MSDSRLFERALFRGLNDGLVRHNFIRYPDYTTQNKVADHVAKLASIANPVMEPDKFTMKTAAHICGLLVDAANAVSDGENIKTAAAIDTFQKIAAADPVALANFSTEDLLNKVAMEMADEGENTPDQSRDGDALEDNKERPMEGYANHGRGESVMEGPQTTGDEEGVGETSAKVAMPLAMKSDPENKPSSGDMDSKRDLAERPDGYAVKPQTTDSAVKGDVIGDEVAVGEHPSVEVKAAMVLLQKAASLYGDLLPNNLDDQTKVAHLRRLSMLTPEESAAYIGSCYKQAGLADAQVEKIASVVLEQIGEKLAEDKMPEGLRKKMEEKSDESQDEYDEDADQDSESKEEEKEEKEAHDKGAADLGSLLKNLS